MSTKEDARNILKRFFIVGAVGLLLFSIIASEVSATTVYAQDSEPTVSATGTILQDRIPTAAKNAESVYSVKKHPAEATTTKEVLLLYSISPKSEDYRDIEVLTQIIASHWNVHIDIRSFQDVTLEEAAAYPYIIFVEQQAETDAILFYWEVISHSDARTLWIGFGEDTAVRGVPPTITHEDVVNIEYKGVTFESDQYLHITSLLPQQTPDFVPLATYTTTDGVTRPLIGMFEDTHLIAAITVPNQYEVNTYTLPFLDSLHYFLGRHVLTEPPPALLRLEDVNVHTYRSGRKLNKVDRFLHHNGIPYHIAFIERYLNPPEGIDIESNDSSRFLNIIKKMINESGAVLVQHGYTHQINDDVSAVGYEFWDAQNHSPLHFDSVEEAIEHTQSRILAAQAGMVKTGLPVPDIWETPHYAQSELDDVVINQYYQLRYQHIPMYGSLPFAAQIDGAIYIPEVLGYVTDTDTPERKAKTIERLSTFDDPVASVFWHPWRPMRELKELTSIIEDAGYSFVTAYDLVDRTEQKQEKHLDYSLAGMISITTLIYIVFFSFIVGVIAYARNVYLVRKYVRQIRDHHIQFEEVEQAALERNVEIPTLSLFIPARNEGLVIGNTLRRIAKLVYPKDRLQVYVIVDERELDDDVPRTTKEVALETATALHQAHGADFIHIIEVPKWYSGVFGTVDQTYARSTKGRALNYCLQVIDASKLDMIGILDADGRLHPDVLMEAALNRIHYDAKVLQGPVFQVSNFKDVNIVGRAAGLELALHHLTELPHRLHQRKGLQFFAGTNYFVDAKCIVEAGGWDQNALVEDAEIALRLYTTHGIIGRWLNSPEIEQTPANFKIYRKQRHRWVRGHIDLIKQVHESTLSRFTKARIYFKIATAQLRFLFDVSLPIVSITLMLAGMYSYLAPVWGYISIVLFFASIAIWDTYGFMYRTLSEYIDPNMSTGQAFKQSLIHLLFMPIFIVVQAIPRFTALYSYIFNKEQGSWYKTERTAEAVIQ